MISKKSKSYKISVSSRKINSSWWGNAWKNTIESYSDYSNRLPRARTYLRSGRVSDLVIEPGYVSAKVKGSNRRSYTVNIAIDPVSREDTQEIKELFQDQIESMEELLAGKFPKTLEEKLLGGKSPLFPEVDQISFACSCPDWAYLCKHVGAVLYGIGVVFDDDPSLFFTLRNLDISDLIQDSIDQRIDSYLERAKKASGRLIENEKVLELFGQDL